MANPNGSSPTRVELYESLYLIAQATHQITTQLERLRSAKLLTRDIMELQRLAAHHLRADIAASAIHNLTAPEVCDAGRYERQHLRLQRKLAGGEPKIKPSQK